MNSDTASEISTEAPSGKVATEQSEAGENKSTDDGSAKSSTAPCPMEVDGPLQEASNQTGSGEALNENVKWPKVSLRLNEFGIYELAPDDQQETTTLPVNVAETAVVPSQVATAPAVEATSTSKPVTVSSAGTGNNNASSNNGSERERWKQRFPSNAKVPVDIVCCKQCDGYGIADEFVDQHYCSEKCRKLGLTRQAQMEKKARDSTGGAGKVAVKRKSTSSNPPTTTLEGSHIVESSLELNDRSSSDDSRGANKSSGWSWSKYLERRRAQAAPERLFTDPFPYGKHGFRVGMKLEGIDPEHQSLFCVLAVAEVQGYRLRLHFDGYSDSHDVWLNADSENLFPVGWCEKNGQKLRPPKNYTVQITESLGSSHSPTHGGTQPNRSFNWQQYLKSTGSTAAPRQNFVSTQNESPLPSAFRVKMKLEAVDRRHSSHTLCVATVANVIGSRFLVHFDGWDNIYDYWADPTCPYVHPVGWAEEHNTTLTPPCDYDGADGEFSWDQYLAKTGTTAVPPRAFKPRSPIGFKTGMKLECVDPRNPQLIRVASVAAVKGYRLKIHFDGWANEFDFWTDDDWPDLHPPGWCQKTGHPLQPPLTTETAPPSKGDVKGEHCPTPGCNGVGHIEGARYASHATADDCPYSNHNLHRDSPAYPDRLQGEDLSCSDPLPRAPSPSISSSADDGQVAKEDTLVQRKVKVVKTEDSSTPSSPIPPPPKFTEQQPDGGSSAGKANKVSPNDQPSIDLPIKSESEAELNSRLLQVDLRPDSPSNDNQYDSLEALTPPPPKKMRISYFSGKSAVTENSRRKSILDDKGEHGDESGRHSQIHENDASMMSCSGQARQAMQDFFQPSGNSSLTTPLFWSKHAALLDGMVAGATTGEALKWSPVQVREFLSKFGLNNSLLEKFREEQIDGEALMYLTQSDLTDLLGVKLGPAIKIRNALLLMMEKSKSGTSA